MKRDEAQEEWQDYQRRQALKAAIFTARREFARRCEIINAVRSLTAAEREGAVAAARSTMFAKLNNTIRTCRHDQ